MKKLILVLLLCFLSTPAYAKITEISTPWNCMYGFHLQGLFNTCVTIDSDLLTLIQTLSPKVVRFPSGTPANYYRYDEATHTLIGQNEAQEIDLTEAARVMAILDADVIYVANVYTAEPSEVVSLITWLIANGVNIVGVELGNELYWPTYKQLDGNIEGYIVKAKACNDAIKAVYPTMKTAVCGASVGMAWWNANSAIFPRSVAFVHYATRLAKEPWYDAVVIHNYLGFRDCTDEDIGETDPDGCLVEQMEDYCNTTLVKMFQQHLEWYGKYREFWFTEWNLHFLASSSESCAYGNTIAQAIHAMKTTFAVQKINRDYLNNQIKYMCYHQLVNCLADVEIEADMAEGGASVVSPLGATRKFALLVHRMTGEEALDVGTDYIKTCAYYPFLMLEPLCSSNTTWDDSLADLRTTVDVGLEVHTFKDATKIYIVLINTSGTDTAIDYLTVRGTSIRRTTWARYQRLYGESLHDSRGFTYTLDPFTTTLATYTDTAAGVIKEFTIPHYSVGIMTITIP